MPDLVVGLLLALGEAKLPGSIVSVVAARAPRHRFTGGGLVVVALIATAVPGLAALRIAPMQVLRQE